MKTTLLFLALLFFSTTLSADKFVVKSFKRLDNKIMLNKDKRPDDNDELCAIVLVRTSIMGLGMSASTPIEGNVNWRQGDYWVYLSAGTRMLKFFKKGYDALEYTFPQRIEKGKFYLLVLEYRRTNVSAAENTMGFVVINSRPPGAEVFINDTSTGLQTPFQNPYNEGYYRYTLKKPFYDDYTGDFTIVSGKTQHVNVNLVPDYGSLKLAFTPATAVSISVDGNISQQNSPYFVDKLKPGKHTLILKKANYDDYPKSFTINKGQTTTITVNMMSVFGYFTVSTNPEVNAKLSIDGNQYPGTTPFTQIKLLPGKHTLRLAKEMYKTYEQEFTIKKGEKTKITATMKSTVAKVTIHANSGDRIFIDGQEKGTETYSERLLKGNHIIKVKHANYYPESRQITIVPGREITDTFTLKPMTGNLSIMTTPIGATVYLNGVNKGQSPLFINKLMIGNYTLKFQKQGYATIEMQASVTENKTTILKQTLPDAINVHISSIPEGAKLYVDGQYKGTTPVTLPLNFEKHNFKLEKDRYVNYTVTKTINLTDKQLIFPLKLYYNLSISSKPDGASVYNDGVYIGTTPNKFSLKPGKHQIELKAGDFLSRKKNVFIKEKLITKSFHLKPEGLMGLGYIWGEGSKGVNGADFFINTDKYEMILDLIGITPNTNDSTIIGAIQGGYRIPYPIDFSIHGGFGFGWHDFYNNDRQDHQAVYSLIVGITLPVYLINRYGIYIKTDYCLLSSKKNGLFLFSVGVAIGSNKK